MLDDTSTDSRQAHITFVQQKGGYDFEAAWYLTKLSELMGETSNHERLVAAIKRGGSGGNKGTKGIGVTRVEPFTSGCKCDGEFKTCHRCSLTLVHAEFDRARDCERAWRAVGRWTQWLLAARYCLRREKLAPGLHGQLGDLSAVAIVCAFYADECFAEQHKYDDPELVPYYESQVDRLIAGASKKNALRWAEKEAAAQLQRSHEIWRICRIVAPMHEIHGPTFDFTDMDWRRFADEFGQEFEVKAA